MSYKLLIATVLVVPGLSWGQEAPDRSEVQDRESQTVPQSELDVVDRELEEARTELAKLVAQAEADDAEAERVSQELMNAREDRTLNDSVSQANVDTAWYEVEEAQERLSAAKQSRRVQKTELKLAKQRGDKADISRARAMLTSAKKEVSASRAEIAVAESQYRQIHRAEDGHRAEQDEVVASSKLERTAVSDRRDLTDEEIEVAQARVDALEAVRARVMAEIEYERAESAGEMQSLDMLRKALQDAREAEMHASARLKELEAS